eukprot:scaffold485788_cov15-Prasinocladus_malaysianus.AAC.1
MAGASNHSNSSAYKLGHSSNCSLLFKSLLFPMSNSAAVTKMRFRKQSALSTAGMRIFRGIALTMLKQSVKGCLIGHE